nr:TlpA disulfide reductase family protein [uncultured Mucilaginibacter sp.]
MMKNILTSLALYFCITSASAQISIVTPQKPSLTDTIKLSYNCTDSAAALNNSAAIYARVTTSLEDGSINKFNITMVTAGNKMFNQFTLPANAASFKVEFYTLNKEDPNAIHHLLVYNHQHNKPVKSAYIDAMFNEKPDSLFNKEIANYPNNYLAYAKFMNIVALVKDQQTAHTQIVQLMQKLNNVHPDNEDAGLLAALCIGNAKTANLSIAKKYLYQLLDQFPQTQQTAFAFSIYNYEYYKVSQKAVEDDVRAKIRSVFINYPNAPISADGNVIQFLKSDETIPLTAFENVLKLLTDADKIQYYELTNLPEIYLERQIKLDSATQLLTVAIQRFQNGTINHQYRLNYSHYQLYAPLMYMDLAKICLLKKDYLGAITNASAANNIIAGSNSEGNFLPLLLDIRASAYTMSGNLNMAMEDYKRLYKMGHSGAIDSMRTLFPLCAVKQKTFAEFISSLKKAGTDKTTAGLSMAPDITATDMKGNLVRLSDFKNKIVVLNIWGIGCGPCIAEMPQLNQIVKQYVNNPNVVFLAITGDKTANLAKFLKNHSFNYTVLNNAGNLTEKLNTNSLPVHMVIGKQGEILNRSIGAREDIKSYLVQIINSNL